MEANTCKDKNIAIGFFNPVTFNSCTVGFTTMTDAMCASILAQDDKSLILLPYKDGKWVIHLRNYVYQVGL